MCGSTESMRTGTVYARVVAKHLTVLVLKNVSHVSFKVYG